MRSMMYSTIPFFLGLAVTATPLTSPQGADKQAIVCMPFKRVYSNFSVPLTNAEKFYTIEVRIGTPPQPQTLLLDTGSSNIWVYGPDSHANLSDTFYNPSLSSTAVNVTYLDPFNISYGAPDSGVYGYFVSDSFEVNGVTAQHIDIAVATISHTGDPPGGIMGIGLDAGEALNGAEERGSHSYPGYVDQLALQGLINVRAYSLYLADQSYTDLRTGTILFGGYDPSKYTGDLVPLPIVASPADTTGLSVNWSSISVTVNGQTTLLNPAPLPYPALLDSGTDIAGVPPSVFAELINYFPVQFDNITGNWLVDCGIIAIDGTVDFGFQGHGGAVTIAVAYKELAEPVGNGTCVFGIQPAPPPLEPLFLVLGEPFLRSAYVLFNFDAGTISLAQVNFDSTCGDCAIALQK